MEKESLIIYLVVLFNVTMIIVTLVASSIYSKNYDLSIFSDISDILTAVKDIL